MHSFCSNKHVSYWNQSTKRDKFHSIPEVNRSRQKGHGRGQNKGAVRCRLHIHHHCTWNDFWPLFGGAGAIFLSLAADARVTRVLVVFTGSDDDDDDDRAFTGFDRGTSALVTDVEDGVAIGVAVCCRGRSSSAIAS